MGEINTKWFFKWWILFNCQLSCLDSHGWLERRFHLSCVCNLCLNFPSGISTTHLINHAFRKAHLHLFQSYSSDTLHPFSFSFLFSLRTFFIYFLCVERDECTRKGLTQRRGLYLRMHHRQHPPLSAAVNTRVPGRTWPPARPDQLYVTRYKHGVNHQGERVHCSNSGWRSWTNDTAHMQYWYPAPQWNPSQG